MDKQQRETLRAWVSWYRYQIDRSQVGEYPHLQRGMLEAELGAKLRKAKVPWRQVRDAFLREARKPPGAAPGGDQRQVF